MENCNEKDLLMLFTKETIFIENFLLKHPRNYYAWSHRLLILKSLIINLKKEKIIGLLENEMRDIKKYCEKNIHEYSAFHYLQFLIRKLKEENCLDINEEKAWVIQLIVIYEECYDTNEKKIDKNERTVSELFSLKKHLIFLNKS